MTKKIRSIKGEIVDFDLIKIKQQIAAGQAPVNVKEREEFIDKKVHRRKKKLKVNPAKLDINVEPLVEDEVEVEEDIKNEDIKNEDIKKVEVEEDIKNEDIKKVEVVEEKEEVGEVMEQPEQEIQEEEVVKKAKAKPVRKKK